MTPTDRSRHAQPSAARLFLLSFFGPEAKVRPIAESRSYEYPQPPPAQLGIRGSGAWKNRGGRREYSYQLAWTDPHLGHVACIQPAETLWSLCLATCLATTPYPCGGPGRGDALSTSQIALSSSTRAPVRWFVYVYRTLTPGFTKDWCPQFPPPPAGACRACRLGCGAPTAPPSLCRLARGSLLAAPPFSPPFPSAVVPLLTARLRAWRSCPRRRQRGRTARCAACM